MQKLALTLVVFAVAAGTMGAATVVAYSIPADQLDAKKVFWGEPANFDKPGEVNYQQVIKATPEYKELKEKKVEKGTGRYWILLSKASDRAVQAIAGFGEDSEFDLITAEGYLASLTPAIPAENVTKLIIKAMEAEKGSSK